MRAMRACVLAFALAIKPSDFFGAYNVDDDPDIGADGDVCASAAVAMINAALVMNTIRGSDVARTMFSSPIGRRSVELKAANSGNRAPSIFR
jgi:hypothetical protein